MKNTRGKIAAPESMYNCTKSFGELVKETAHLNPVRILLGETKQTNGSRGAFYGTDSASTRCKRAVGGEIPGGKSTPIDVSKISAGKLDTADQKNRMKMMLGKDSK